MKKSTLPPALPYPVKVSNAPKLAYQEALSRFLRTGQGELVTVEACPEPQFQAFIDTCLCAFQPSGKAAQARFNACKTDVAGLEWDHLSKWFALLALQECDVPIPLFASYKDASTATHQEMIS